jgi:hypothetical protein
VQPASTVDARVIEALTYLGTTVSVHRDQQREASMKGDTVLSVVYVLGLAWTVWFALIFAFTRDIEVFLF